MAPSDKRLKFLPNSSFTSPLTSILDRKPIDPEILRLIKDDDDDDFLSEESDNERKLKRELGENVRKLKPTLEGEGGLMSTSSLWNENDIYLYRSLDLQDDFFTIARGGRVDKPLKMITGKDGITFQEKKRRKRSKKKSQKHPTLAQVKAAFEKFNKQQEEKTKASGAGAGQGSEEVDEVEQPALPYTEEELQAWREEAKMLSVEEIMERMSLFH